MSSNRYGELYNAINDLEPQDRALIHYIYWEDLSLRQIAEVLSVSFQTLSVRHQRILRDLGRQLNGSPLGESRVYSDGAYWMKCTGCHKWTDTTVRCSCGAPDPALRAFDFSGYTLHDVDTLRNTMPKPRVNKGKRRSYLERKTSELEKQADAILREAES